MSANAIGIDLSLSATGIASSRGWCLKLGVDGITKLPLLERVTALRALRLRLATEIGHPDIVCIETPALSRSRGGVFERGWLWFAIAGALVDIEVPIVGVDPNQLKLYATGKGGAAKGVVLVEVTKRWPQFDTKGDDNMADATVLAAIGAELLGDPLCSMPATHRAALAKLRLPEGVSA